MSDNESNDDFQGIIRLINPDQSVSGPEEQRKISAPIG